MKASRRNPAAFFRVEFAPQDQHGDRLAHPRSNELVGIWVEDDLVERVRIAVENRRHDPMCGARYSAAQDRIDLVVRTSQQTC